MARNDLTIRAQRSPAAPILSIRRSTSGSLASSRSIIAWPTTTDSGLFSSCATPARSSPRADSFSFWKIVSRCASSSALSATSRVMSTIADTITSSPRYSIIRAETDAGNGVPSGCSSVTRIPSTRPFGRSAVMKSARSSRLAKWLGALRPAPSSAAADGER